MTWSGLDATTMVALAIALLFVGSVGTERHLRIALSVAGVAGVATAALGYASLIVAAGGVALAVVNLLKLLRMRGGVDRLDDDARLFAQRHLSLLPARDAALLIGQGAIVTARAGEQLTREGHLTDRLYFLVSGSAAVMVDGKTVGGLLPGDMVGEASLLDDAHATATVEIAEDARLWFAEARVLKPFLALHPRIAAALAKATLAALRDKLGRSNRAASAAVTPA